MFSGVLAGFLKVAAVAVVTGGFAGGIYWAVQISESEGSSAFGQAVPSATVTIAPQGTAAPTATPQPPLPTDPPAYTATPKPPQPPAPTAMFTPKPTCPPRTNNHLNMDLMRLQPGLTDAVISEIDDNRIRIVVQGVEFIITGVGKLVGLGGTGDPSSELRTQMWRAVDAVRYQC